MEKFSSSFFDRLATNNACRSFSLVINVTRTIHSRRFIQMLDQIEDWLVFSLAIASKRITRIITMLRTFLSEREINRTRYTRFVSQISRIASIAS